MIKFVIHALKRFAWFKRLNAKVTYELLEQNGKTTLKLTQDNNPSQEAADRSAKNWEMVLQGLKKIVEH